MQNVDQLNVLLVAGALQFALGGLGMAARRSFLVSVVSSGVMLQGTVLAWAGASVFHATWPGQVAALVIPIVCLTQVVVAAALAWEFRQDDHLIKTDTAIDETLGTQDGGRGDGSNR